MERTLPRLLALPWRRIGVAVYIGVNVGLILYMRERPGPQNVDWQIWLQIREVLGPSGGYYTLETPVPFIWSPVAAWIVAGISLLGYWPWFALHYAALWLLRSSPLLVLLAATSWGLYVDALQGNVFGFVFVAGVLALRGSRAWTLAYLVLVLLMPRPVQMPLAAVLLWRDRDLWLPFAALFVAHAGIVVGTGQLIPWAEAIIDYSHASDGYNLGPTMLFGLAWLIVGIPLAGWLAWKGRPGWAGLALSTYVMPQYLLAPLWNRGSR